MVTKYLGFTLVPQAGVAIGLAIVALTQLPEYGVQIQTVILCATVIYELIGPVITKLALKAGEIQDFKKRQKPQKQIYSDLYIKSGLIKPAFLIYGFVIFMDIYYLIISY